MSSLILPVASPTAYIIMTFVGFNLTVAGGCVIHKIVRLVAGVR